LSKKKRPFQRDSCPSPGTAAPAKFRTSVWLCAVLLLAAALRLAALADISSSPYGGYLLWDEQVYHTWATQIADGTYQSKSVYEFSPLPAYLMAGQYRLFGPQIFMVRLMNTVFGILVCLAVYFIGARMYDDDRAGLIAALITALYGPFILYSVVPLKTSLEIFLFASVAALLIIVLQRILHPPPGAPGGNRPLVIASLLGLTAGLLLNVRPHAVVLLPVPAFLFFWHAAWKRISIRPSFILAAVYLLGIVTAAAPFAARNWIVSGEAAITTSQAGFNLYIGNRLGNPDPYYRPVPFASSSPFEQGIQFTIEASRRSGRPMTPNEASGYWIGETLREAAERPADFAGKVGQKILASANRFEACDHYSTDFVALSAPFFRLPLPSFALVFPLAVIGIATGLSASRRSRAASLLLLLYAATLVVFFTNGRYRAPMMAILIPFTAIGLLELQRILRRGVSRQAVFLAGTAVLCAVIEFLPVRGTDDTTAYLNTHAIVLRARGNSQEALHFWKQSSDMRRPFSAFADLSLAGYHFSRNDELRGRNCLDRIPDWSFAAAQKYELLGDFLVSRRRIDDAAAAYEKSLSFNWGQLMAREKLIVLYDMRDRGKAVRERETLKYVKSFYDIL
jgi:4-amino-4-deoxy-L-arabinose transferase-like glycosyltransferase